MVRTTLVLPDRLKRQAIENARAEGISFGEFVRRALERALQDRSRTGGSRRDPLLSDHAVFRGKAPRDISEHHDRYLYEDKD